MRLPNGPEKRSFLYVRTIQWIFRPLEFLETYAQRYGDPFKIGGGTLPMAVYFSHPASRKYANGCNSASASKKPSFALIWWLKRKILKTDATRCHAQQQSKQPRSKETRLQLRN